MTRWIGEVHVLTTRRWLPPVRFAVDASSVHHAGRQVLLEAKRKLPRGTRISSVKLTLSKIPATTTRAEEE